MEDYPAFGALAAAETTPSDTGRATANGSGVVWIKYEANSESVEDETFFFIGERGDEMGGIVLLFKCKQLLDCQEETTE